MKHFTDEEEKHIQEEYEALLNNCPKCTNEENRAMVDRAMKLAHKAHYGARRKSGEPYIFHPLAVARIVSEEIGLGSKSVICALMHDVVEDTEYTLGDIEKMFNEKIASIIDGLTKISGVFDSDTSLQAENFRKMLLTMSDDVRVILIKLADRLHNMRTLDAMPEHKKMKIAGETLFLYAPLAHRLGLYSIKSELEDLCLKHQEPKAYADIQSRINKSRVERDVVINDFIKPISDKLNRHGIKHTINGRQKSVYSVWRKMKSKNVPFEEIYDLFAVRIVLDTNEIISEKSQCWNVYSHITDIYRPRPDRLRDWVSSPKANGYEALHATVMGPRGNWIEVQIRTSRMDDIAERGFAAHWKYKDTEQHENELDKWIEHIRETLENPTSDALEFLDQFKLNLYASEIVVFTPKGETFTLPKNATILDFAYAIHTEIGNTAISGKVNHKLVPLNHRLRSGDQIEVITSKKVRIHREWLNYVVTAKAKSAITASIKAETKNRRLIGKKILEEELDALGLHPNSDILKKLIPGYLVSSKDQLYSKIGSGIIDLSDLKKMLKKNTKSRWVKYWGVKIWPSGKEDQKGKTGHKDEVDKKKPYMLTQETEDGGDNYKIAKCCNPIPGDDVVGYLSVSGEVVIHRRACPEAIKLMSSQGNSIIDAQWAKQKFFSFLARVDLRGIDRQGITAELTSIISNELDVNIRKLFIESHDGIFEGYIDLYVHDVNNLNNLLMKLGKVKGVERVSRIELTGDTE
ncbi:MAG: RelA/SpoT family protein [Bacteroidales bacterium]|jgi:GTP pyrophosphokinase|nr:RelA/SpoT family protein [Bacteroidales bacterium]